MMWGTTVPWSGRRCLEEANRDNCSQCRQCQFLHCGEVQGTGITSEKNPFQRGTLLVFHLCEPVSLEKEVRKEIDVQSTDVGDRVSSDDALPQHDR
jgi:hypothetical protein